MLHASVSHQGGRYGELVFVGVDRFGPTRLNRVTFILDFHDGNYWPMSVLDALEIVFGAPVIQYFDEEDSVRLIVTVVLTAPLRNAEGFVKAYERHKAHCDCYK